MHEHWTDGKWRKYMFIVIGILTQFVSLIVYQKADKNEMNNMP